ncbi:MAG: hypothetical protein UU81_C0020G0008 [Microgenomates group bacterium GW2011_GWC1_41_8]|uniref:Uncharacterized protein n=3 Tax=Candidatus Roizmaniibacteriota TaxID=1752723 RepID=A0A0G0ZH05_9BACT|nr:MAG: hypothetical protein UT85_C0023G0009 [Candidatus Levybacteria bacterium GW2011_GWA2_40_16]KKR71448.1 MAG: hypothetical protein UU14_C0028G0010 [Candidatus Roizmanbacteria bacterium GW2011_GWB1_40_7]KKR92791.1 MAG: hypothetical protein UU41_C0024G0009 [Candidatus Roizmanbacteria bacterium GW2011_GWA1_41_13]KKS21321.1 MAG: hypothetical protein UU78_C0040G0010 [Candidatus Roizmanbacteria bacterium GW2011_GWC2_41_7]KKS23741.1 MAG: hypothetical protein UU81_C0020G0008 [Microgenomates group b
MTNREIPGNGPVDSSVTEKPGTILEQFIQIKVQEATGQFGEIGQVEDIGRVNYGKFSPRELNQSM